MNTEIIEDFCKREANMVKIECAGIWVADICNAESVLAHIESISLEELITRITDFIKTTNYKYQSIRFEA